jgi:cytochrome c oxidase subunit 1
MAVGMLGMRRRIADYDLALGYQPEHIIITIAGFMVAASVLIFFINLWRSARQGELAPGNIWESRSPEWQIPSPTPAHNYETPLVIVGDPYDYGLEDNGFVSLDEPSAHPQPAD